MRLFLRSRACSFGYAFAGWNYLIRTQRNAWIHAAASTTVVLVGVWLVLPARDWAMLVMAMAMVWTAELINTALEVVVDLASPQQHPLAKIGKDVGAGAVLAAALAAVIIGLLILGPPLWVRLGSLFGAPR